MALTQPRPSWFARHFAAMVAAAIVLGVFGWKNRARPKLFFASGQGATAVYRFGWPQTAIGMKVRVDQAAMPAVVEYEYSTYGPWPFVVDGGAVLAASIAAWVTFTLTQRNCRRWRQFSLATILAFVVLIALACAVIRAP